ncbi:MAG: glycosyltransferase family 2 protein [Candidatus Omnitrophica bacterium]|nr:glycosyltransferase family 2 protein [Candidatus Omnitrophota bacterium]
MEEAGFKILSVVMPVYNEKDNIEECLERLNSVLTGLGSSFEVICVDDGSTDGTNEILSVLAKKYPYMRVLQFKKNFGQTAALSAGFDHAKGDLIVTLDSDLQNKPEDIPALIKAMGAGYDVVCGWRRKRRDKLITRRIPSRIANSIISFVTGIKLHDYGCTLRAYRAELVKQVKLYGEMHRFIPALLGWNGAVIAEVEVDHAARTRGRSKYGILRTFKVILDLVTVKLLTSYSTKPIYMFGGPGLILLFFGFISFLIVAYRAILLHRLSATPLIFIMVVLFISGIQMVLTGLLAEINIRTFYEAQNKKIYIMKNKIHP